jgi:hypothetical protein
MGCTKVVLKGNFMGINTYIDNLKKTWNTLKELEKEERSPKLV